MSLLICLSDGKDGFLVTCLTNPLTTDIVRRRLWRRFFYPSSCCAFSFFAALLVPTGVEPAGTNAPNACSRLIAGAAFTARPLVRSFADAARQKPGPFWCPPLVLATRKASVPVTDPGPGRGQHKGTLRRHPHPFALIPFSHSLAHAACGGALVVSSCTPARSQCHSTRRSAPGDAGKGSNTRNRVWEN